MLRRIAYLVCLVAFASPAFAQQTAAERAFWSEAFEMGRSYSADMTLLSYCFRNDPDTSDILYLNVIEDLHAVIEMARTGAITSRQTAAFVREVFGATHFAAPDAADPLLEKACVDRDVVKAYGRMQPIMAPLTWRPPFPKK